MTGQPTIREWVERELSWPGAKTVLECGAHWGEDTAWMAAMPGVVLHALEPDPRNARPTGLPSNVSWHRVAVAAHDGKAMLTQSKANRGRTWTESSSILRPKNHIKLMPRITFMYAPIEVACITLDSFCKFNGIERVDLIWADVQGAEGLMIQGGQRTLARTRHLFTEYSDHEEYEGQPTLAELLMMLPGWRLVERWPYDVLLENALP